MENVITMINLTGNAVVVLTKPFPPVPHHARHASPTPGKAAPVNQRADQPTRPAPKATSRPLPVLLAQLKPLLQSRQTLRAALLLHEILGPPLSQRKRS